MESPKIKILLQKYWEGNSNKTEEAELKRLYKNGIPKEDKKYKLVFDYQEMMSQNQDEFSLDFLDQESTISSSNTRRKEYLSNNWKQLILKVAAVIAIIFGSIFYQWDGLETPQMAQENVMDSAYEETVAALAFLSEKLNKGNSSIYELGAFDKSTKQVINEKF